jgi:hypothetical protein
MKAFGVRGTPSALLLDGDGRFASALGTGGPNVLALIGPSPGHS